MTEYSVFQNGEYIGYLVGGTLKDNLRVRLTVPPQQVQEGGFVVIESGEWQFYGLVTDLQLGGHRPALCRMSRARNACRLAWRGCCTGRPCILTWKCCRP